MTDVTLQNPIVTAVQAVKSGNDVVPVSSSNPLPVSSPYGSTAALESLAGRGFKITAASAAVSGQFGRIQLVNPVNSGEEIILSTPTTWAGTAGTHVYSVYEIPIASVGTLITGVEKNYRAGGDASPLLVYYANSATAIPTTGLLAGGSHASIVSAGTGITYPVPITIPEGRAIEIAISTATVTLNAQVSFYAIPIN